MKTRIYRSKTIQIIIAAFVFAAFSSASFAGNDVVDSAYKRAVTAYESKDYKHALKFFRELQQDYPKSKHAVRCWEYIAQCENILGDPYAAFEAYQKIWDEHKDFNKLSTITKNQMQIANHYRKLKQFKTAIEIYRKILENAPYSESAAVAQYSIAHSMIGREEYYAAKDEFRTLIKNYPTSQFVDDAAFYIGYVDYLQSTEKEYDQTETTQAIAEFRRFIHEFPSSPKVYEAQKYIRKLRNRKAASLFRTGEFYENIRAPKAAKISFREVIEQYPDTDYAERARRRIEKIDGSKIAKSVEIQQITKMMQLQNQKELARNKDLAGRKEIEQKAPEMRMAKAREFSKTAAQTTVSKAPQAERKRKIKKSALLTSKKKMSDKQYASRIKELYKDPQTREELRAMMKKAYLAERLRDKQTRFALSQQKLVARVAPAKIDNEKLLTKNSTDTQTLQKETPKIERINIESKQLEKSFNNNERVASVDDGSEPLSVDYKTVEDVVIDAAPPAKETEKAESIEAITAKKINEIEKPETIEKTTTEKTEIVEKPADGLAFSTTETEDKAKEKEDVAQAKKSEEKNTDFEIDTSELDSIIDFSGNEIKNKPEEKTEEITETPAQEIDQPEEKTEEITEAPAQEITQPEEKTEEVTEAPAQEIAQPEEKTEEVTEAPAQEIVQPDSEDIIQAQIQEQERAAKVRQMVEALKKKDEDNKSEMQIRKLSGMGSVRRAKVAKSSDESKSDALQREYAAIYYQIQSGDASLQRGIVNDAKKYYGKALDGLLEIKRKAPDWETDIINYRIEYCRNKLRNAK